MTGASKGLTTQPGRKVGAPDPLSSQAVRAVPQMLSRQTQERAVWAAAILRRPGGRGMRQRYSHSKDTRGRKDLTWRGHSRRRGTQKH